MSESLGEALPKEQARVRELKKIYESLGLAGAFSAYMMELSLAAADKAVISGNVTDMIVAYEDLKRYKE
jgi:hypothetical protein